MITKEQAMTADNFIQTLELLGEYKLSPFSMVSVFVPDGTTREARNPIKYRRNGKTQVWKTRPDEFKIPIKHGMYSYGYITQDNAHLFEVAQ